MSCGIAASMLVDCGFFAGVLCDAVMVVLCIRRCSDFYTEDVLSAVNRIILSCGIAASDFEFLLPCSGGFMLLLR